MQRYFVSENGWSNNEVTITGDDVHHIHRVMRYQPGDQVICVNNEQVAFICTITDIGETITLHIDENLDINTEMPVQVTIAQGLPKADKMDWILQKGTELGAYGFIPFQAERSIVKWDDRKMDKKISRYQKIVKEASEQSHRNSIPAILPKMDINQLLKESENYDFKWFAYEDEAKKTDHQSIAFFLDKVRPGKRILLIIGPEGGFSVNEVDKLYEKGFHSIRLGPRILRTETACMYALASISYHFEEMEC